MTKFSKCILTFIMLALLAPLLFGNADEKVTTVTVKSLEEQYLNSRILIEAFVVEADLETLYDSGVSPIGQKPNSVSIKHILNCLGDKDSGQVIAGAKIAIRNKERGEMRQRLTRNIQQARPAARTTTTTRTQSRRPRQPSSEFSTEITFQTRAYINTEDTIRTEYTFNQQGFITTTTEPNEPADIVSLDWNGAITLEAGKPAIAGSVQDENSAVFLILCADIETK